MDYRKLGFGLGLFSVGLGIAELAASKRIARSHAAEERDGVVRIFGARELFAGAALLSGPAHSVRGWNRVAGDAMDIAALGLAARRAPQNKAIWGALAFVAATALDIVTAIGLDRSTGKMLPFGQEEDADATSPAAAETPPAIEGKATSIEPTAIPQALAPALG